MVSKEVSTSEELLKKDTETKDNNPGVEVND